MLYYDIMYICKYVAILLVGFKSFYSDQKEHPHCTSQFFVSLNDPFLDLSGLNAAQDL